MDDRREPFDLCVIGAGPGGFAGAMRAIDAGRRVCLIEAGEIGGAGVKWGALASKTMWELSKDYAVAAKRNRGYAAAGLTVDYGAVRATVIEAVKEKQHQMLAQLEAFAPGRRRGSGTVTYRRGWGRLAGDGRVAVNLEGGGREEITTRHVLLATGSMPRHSPQVPVDQKRVFDSDGILEMKAFPRRLLIVGAGVTGCEYATIFSNFGQTEVLLVDHQERVIPYEDEDVSDFVSRNLAAAGVRIFHATRLGEVAAGAGRLEAVLKSAGGRIRVVEVDAILLAIGRSPNTMGLNLAAAGLEADSNGYIPCDRDCRVKGGIYAAGDIIHRPALVNMAVMESRHAVKHMFGLPAQPLEFPNMSTVMFFSPAVAAVGLNEKDCRRRKIPYRVATYANALLPRAIAMRATSGFIKIIVSDDGRERILGMRAAGPQVSSTIMSIALLIDQEKRATDILGAMYPHPTMSEGIQECLRLVMGKSVYKPEAFPGLLRLRRWDPEAGFRT